MAAIDDIRALLEKRQSDLRQSDIDEIGALLVRVPLDQIDEVEGWVWEAVALIVDHPLYTGDGVLPDSSDS